MPENGPANPCSGPTPEKMEQCRWVKPKLVCQVAFVEWTDAGHLRHCTFVAMRDDKKAEVVRETDVLLVDPDRKPAEVVRET